MSTSNCFTIPEKRVPWCEYSKKALDSFNTAIRLSEEQKLGKNMAYFYINRGQLLAFYGDPKKALEDIMKYIGLYGGIDELEWGDNDSEYYEFQRKALILGRDLSHLTGDVVLCLQFMKRLCNISEERK